MKLEEYPLAIKNLSMHLLSANKRVYQAQMELDALLADLEASIAFDDQLRNDAQRKAKRAELMVAEPIIGLANEVRDAKANAAAVEIELNFIRDKFKILMLEKRESIVSMELQRDAA